jgi:hypothetical protein
MLTPKRARKNLKCRLCGRLIFKGSFYTFSTCPGMFGSLLHKCLDAKLKEEETSTNLAVNLINKNMGKEVNRCILTLTSKQRKRSRKQ